MSNHERSKKHKEMVALLRQQLQHDDSLAPNLDQPEDVEQESKHLADEREEEEEEEEDRPRQKLSKKQKKKKRQQKAATSTPAEEQTESAPDGKPISEEYPETFTEEVQGNIPEESSNPTEAEKDDHLPPAEPKSSVTSKTKKAESQDKPKNVKAHSGGEQFPEKAVKLSCVTCNSEFSTRNKLFDHLKSSGHATAVSSNSTASASRSKKDKRKNR